LLIDVIGSRGNIYNIRIFPGGEPTLCCSCPAGRGKLRFCRHQAEIIAGDYANVAPGQEASIADLSGLFEGTSLRDAAQRYLARRAAGLPAQPSQTTELREVRIRRRRTERLSVTFVDDVAEGWAFGVPIAARDALDVLWTPLVDQDRTRIARIADRTCKPIMRMAWTQGISPLFAFAKGDIFYSPPSVRRLPWRMILQEAYAIVAVEAASPDGIGQGLVVFRLWTQPFGDMSAPTVHRCSQAAFVELLRYGVIPPEADQI
jgi:hypothetical protein